MCESKKALVYYQTDAGRLPFEEWLKNLGDKKARYVIPAKAGIYICAEDLPDPRASYWCIGRR